MANAGNSWPLRTRGLEQTDAQQLLFDFRDPEKEAPLARGGLAGPGKGPMGGFRFGITLGEREICDRRCIRRDQ